MDWSWVSEGVACGEGHLPGTEARSALLAELPADRDQFQASSILSVLEQLQAGVQVPRLESS